MRNEDESWGKFGLEDMTKNLPKKPHVERCIFTEVDGMSLEVDSQSQPGPGGLRLVMLRVRDGWLDNRNGNHSLTRMTLSEAKKLRAALDEMIDLLDEMGSDESSQGAVWMAADFPDGTGYAAGDWHLVDVRDTSRALCSEAGIPHPGEPRRLVHYTRKHCGACVATAMEMGFMIPPRRKR